MADYGIKITQDGDDVSSAATKDLVFTSSANSVKVLATGTLDIEPADASSTDTGRVAHNLGYKPGFLVFVRCDIDWDLTYPNWCKPEGNLATDPPKFLSWVDSTYLNVKCWGSQSTDNIARYYILVEQGR